jgi:type IV secretory pathway VirD2 relaxase
VSPENPTEMADLRAFTRELMADAERDLGTKLDWIGVDHRSTVNPHIHVLVRGRADDGADLVISRDYIKQGLRDRAAERVTIELGPRTEQEIRTALEKEVRRSAGRASIARCVISPMRAAVWWTSAPVATERTRS